MCVMYNNMLMVCIVCFNIHYIITHKTRRPDCSGTRGGALAVTRRQTPGGRPLG